MSRRTPATSQISNSPDLSRCPSVPPPRSDRLRSDLFRAIAIPFAITPVKLAAPSLRKLATNPQATGKSWSSLNGPAVHDRNALQLQPDFPDSLIH